jgi:hypothetical protein
MRLLFFSDDKAQFPFYRIGNPVILRRSDNSLVEGKIFDYCEESFSSKYTISFSPVHDYPENSGISVYGLKAWPINYPANLYSTSLVQYNVHYNFGLDFSDEFTGFKMKNISFTREEHQNKVVIEFYPFINGPTPLGPFNHISLLGTNSVKDFIDYHVKNYVDGFDAYKYVTKTIPGGVVNPYYYYTQSGGVSRVSIRNVYENDQWLYPFYVNEFDNYGSTEASDTREYGRIIKKAYRNGTKHCYGWVELMKVSDFFNPDFEVIYDWIFDPWPDDGQPLTTGSRWTFRRNIFPRNLIHPNFREPETVIRGGYMDEGVLTSIESDSSRLPSSDFEGNIFFDNYLESCYDISRLSDSDVEAVIAMDRDITIGAYEKFILGPITTTFSI